ncbi:hypothetical protein EPUL_006699 [Erysiphe pulchra]|uniref:Sin3 binding protein n=1 Tax=Erysiphe pulchra TaxID=225359 RepID=A0A2S4PM78_9PEZI|nr:hypothetical protein EPUL_006699 [Erysiphe pulchra]
MASIACDVRKNSPVQDGYVAIAPKAASPRARDGYVIIAPKSAAMTSKSEPLANTPILLSPNLPPHKPKSYITRSSKIRAASESLESHPKYRKSPRGHSKAVKSDKAPKFKPLDSKDIGKTSLASARWDGYVHIAPKGTTTNKSQTLATPPSSVSPSLPAEHIKPYSFRSHPTPSSIERTKLDANIQKTPETLRKPVLSEHHTKTQIPLKDNLGAITPALLARYHLPGILIKHGPLAIRHIMSFLSSVVPGFSKISPAKSRRLVVSALERRVSEGITGDLENGVTFEKVGWGRWNARLNGRSRSESNMIACPNSPSSCKSDSQIAQRSEWNYENSQLKASRSSLHDDSILFSHSEDMDVDVDVDTRLAGIERDRLSLDSCETYSSPVSIDEDELMSDNSSDTTDDEDWAALGAAALRAASYSTFTHTSKFLSSQAYKDSYRADDVLPFSTLIKSSPQRHSTSDSNFTTHSMTPNSQEREAVEALLNLGST